MEVWWKMQAPFIFMKPLNGKFEGWENDLGLYTFMKTKT